MRTVILFLSWSVSFSGLLGQGPISGFLTPKGEVVLAGTYSSDVYDTYLLADGNSETRDLEAISYSFFMEVGTGPNTNLVVTLPYIETNAENSSLQDASIWLKYANVYQEKEDFTSAFFTAVGLTFPVGNYPVDNFAAIGQRATVFNGRLVYQLQSKKYGWFVSAISGLDFQLSPESRIAWPLLLRGGWGGSFLYVEGWFEIVRALESGVDSQTAVAGTGSSWNRLGATVYVPVTKWLGFTLGGAWITGGEFIGQSNRLNLGAVFKLNPGGQ